MKTHGFAFHQTCSDKFGITNLFLKKRNVSVRCYVMDTKIMKTTTIITNTFLMKYDKITITYLGRCIIIFIFYIKQNVVTDN
jgi:hypothetical protein